MKIDLSGRWSFDIDPDKIGIEQGFFNLPLLDDIQLPGTVSSNRIGESKKERHSSHLTDPYAFEGYAWFARYLTFEQFETHEYRLHLERTRIAHVWLDEQYVDSRDSLVSPHEYDLTPFLTKKKHRVTILVDNSSYPISGGHMTSKDTQTNWNGILGDIYLDVRPKTHLLGIRLNPSYRDRRLDVSLILHGSREEVIQAQILDNGEPEGQSVICADSIELKGGSNRFSIELPADIEAWSEHRPKLYQLRLVLHEDHYDTTFGVRDFEAAGRAFLINGERTFLRGKHDGMVFPLTAYAPTDVESWLTVMQIAKDHGINHYRFHTCCPPDAAFAAADRLGIYMEPELPLWGTVATEVDQDHSEAQEAYLISEGFRILDAFGNHPSFVMMSLGNELWGSRERIDEILAVYRHYDPRPLYTQGSNNFQFSPKILDNEDFFVAVRFGRDRLIRGSYAMCDAPLGHIQTDRPNSKHNYDRAITAAGTLVAKEEAGRVQVQYGSGTKVVEAEAAAELIPQIPVVSHEIGQYAMYPKLDSESDYTGVLKASYLDIVRERLEAKGLLDQAEAFYHASGRFAVDLYKAEIESALRSRELAGFQLLDLQDFPGQGIALVGILDAFMQNKGHITPERWREFCSPVVLLAEFERFVFTSGELLSIPIQLSHFGDEAVLNPLIELCLFREGEEVSTHTMSVNGSFKGGLFMLGKAEFTLPKLDDATKLECRLNLADSDIQNRYNLWVFPDSSMQSADLIELREDVLETSDWQEARGGLEAGKRVIYYAGQLDEERSIEGTYCTDFWCYPMFRSISEKMGKPLPIGTHGLLIENDHPLFDRFPAEFYSTPQWYDIVSNGRAQILDGTIIRPLVSTIDNFERNHKLGNLWEAEVGEGKLFVSTTNLREHDTYPVVRYLANCLREYVLSAAFNPQDKLSPQQLDRFFRAL